MAWVTEALVEGELSYNLTDSTQPTSAETAEFITSIEAVVKGVLHSLKIDPDAILLASTPNAYYAVQLWALFGVCSRVLAAAGGLIRAQTDKEKEYWSRFHSYWHDLKEDPSILGNDAPFYTGDLATLWPDGIVAADTDDYHEPIFTMDKEF